jgi:hypothetical protein
MLSAQNGQLMLKSDQLEFERGAAAKTEGKDRNNRGENRHHDRHGTAASRKSPAVFSPVEILSKDKECLSKMILFGEGSLRRALSEYVEHFHAERNHQGKGNVLLFPRDTGVRRTGAVQCRERLGGLLRYYHQEAA